ncbi:MAG: ABC transporter ATP-binding protein [Lachnospiraceae bacterium]|nr:ABC transporter ATP-binding protein [Lachnospiraceae bacterium]
MELFRCEHLTKIIGKYRLNDINFCLQPGTVLGLIGINGSGKTTLLRSIIGSYRLDGTMEDRGELILNGSHFRSNAKEYRSQIAYVLQESPFSKYMTPMEIGETYGPYYEGFALDKFRNLLKEYELPEKKMLFKLSKGQLLRMQLAFALSYPALLYVMDEPVGNLDIEFRDIFYDTVRNLVSNEKSSVIISSHLVTELEHIADNLLWLGRTEDTGYIRYGGTIDQLKDCFRILSIPEEKKNELPKEMIMGEHHNMTHNEFLLYDRGGDFGTRIPEELRPALRYADLQEIMYFIEKKAS